MDAMTRQEFRENFDKIDAYLAARKQAEAEHGVKIIGALRMAKYAGAEARVNGKKFMSADDRGDIAAALDVEWAALTESTANLLIDEWQRGMRLPS